LSKKKKLKRGKNDYFYNCYGIERNDSLVNNDCNNCFNSLGEQIMDNDYIYTPVGTDITIRWKLHGYVPPSELPEYLAKWKYYQELPLRRLDDNAKKEYELVMKKAKVMRVR
jgi:hypothetical protein